MEKDFFILKKLLHILIKKGKKAKALRFFLKVLAQLKNNKQGLTNYQVIYQSFINIKPLLHIQKFRKGSKVFNLPKYINNQQMLNLSLIWFLKSVNARKERKVEQRLEKEFFDCFFNKGLTILKKRSTYNTILINRPFLHLLRKL
jgi:ribosomal protein S7